MRPLERTRSIWRAIRLLEHVLTGIALSLGIAAVQAAGHNPAWLPPLVSWWHRRLCAILHLRIEVGGQREDTALLVANHLSWIDIPLIGSLSPTVFLSKAEVRRWPLIGWLAAVAGTLFIERGAHQTERTNRKIAALLEAGQTVMVFPEGTSGDGTRVARFHPRLFAAGQQARTLVQPVAIRYGRGPAPHPVAPFVGNDALVPHLLRVLRTQNIQAQVNFLPALDAAGLSRRVLAEKSRDAIAETLGVRESAPDSTETEARWTAPACAPAQGLPEVGRQALLRVP
jgi:1-acyl-sn-glycerol-3-phosphate acyltransferase